MKLIKQTYSSMLIWLIPVLVAGSLFCYHMIRYIGYEETDEFLSYEMERLIAYHRMHNDLPEFTKVAAIIKGIRYDTPLFKDTLILETGDNEMVPYRELYFTINHNGEDYSLVIRHLLWGRDDILQGTVFIISGILLLILIIQILMISHLSRRIWKPFYKTLEVLKIYRINEPPPQFEKTKIDEFKTLNTTITGLLHKINQDFNRTREFNENASHELQTHLSVIRANTERLMNSGIEDETSANLLSSILNSASKLSQSQKSLLLLSKIGNLEYNRKTEVELSLVIEQNLQIFSEEIQLLQLKVSSELSECRISMDPGLAEIMVNNLVKNSIRHNHQDGFIQIRLSAKEMLISNSGESFEDDPENLTGRFVTGKPGNMGLGLSIVKQICEISGFRFSYSIQEKNLHSLRIFFQNS